MEAAAVVIHALLILVFLSSLWPGHGWQCRGRPRREGADNRSRQRKDHRRHHQVRSSSPLLVFSTGICAIVLYSWILHFLVQYRGVLLCIVGEFDLHSLACRGDQPQDMLFLLQ